MRGGETQRGFRTLFLARKMGERPETEGLLALEFVRFKMYLNHQVSSKPICTNLRARGGSYKQ
jgi:hypothetical protein